MNRPIHLHPELPVDVRAVRDWYESQCPGLGRQFIVAYDESLERIREFPFAYQEFHRDWRRALLARFPFQLAYLILPDEVLIVGLGHQHESPDGFADRLASRFKQQ